MILVTGIARSAGSILISMLDEGSFFLKGDRHDNKQRT